MSIIQTFSGLITVILMMSPAHAQNLDQLLRQQADFSVQYLLQNVSRPDTAPGTVVASPSRSNPDYYFNWVRDGALVMDVLIYLSQASQGRDPRFNQMITKNILAYVDLSRRLQTTPNKSGGLGEPKFNVDGTAFNGDWARPQNDGPPLRAITMINFARLLIAQGQQNYVREKLYDGKIPAQTVIKADLEFVAHHWQEPSFDVWEEVRGNHFYTLMVQRKALLEGAKFAQQLGDGGASQFYAQQAGQISRALQGFWDSKRGHIVTTLNQSGGINYKSSQIDAANILAILHGNTNDGFFAPSSDQVLATLLATKQAFKSIYSINQNRAVGTAIGRYPEDQYTGNGTGHNGGNPWFLNTAAFAETIHRARREFEHFGEVRITALNMPFFQDIAPQMSFSPGTTLKRGEANFTQLMVSMRSAADSYFLRILAHRDSNGMLSEQYNRQHGFMQGANNLTWSYAAFITAYIWRQLN